MEPITVTCFYHIGCCLPCVMSLASLYFWQTVLQHIWQAFSHFNISQSSVATPLRYGEGCNDLFVANFLASVTMKEFRKSVNAWQSANKSSVSFFDSRCSFAF